MFRGRLRVKAAAVAVVAAVLPLALIGCGPRPNVAEDWPDKPGPKVAVSFAPLYCFAANVAGDDATVRNIMSGTGPHDFNPTEQEARRVAKADLFFVVGLGLDEGKAEQMKKGSGNANLKVIELGERLPKGMLCEGTCTHEEHQGEKGHEGHDHGFDPHLWLSPDHAAKMVEVIRDELIQADPAHKDGYERRAAEYVAKLKQLIADGLAMLKGKKDNRLITFHDSLAYFADCFKLEIRGVLTKTPGQEPTEAEMKKLIRICTDEHKPTRLIAVEPQYSTSTSGETLRKELAAKGVENPQLAEIDTLETVKPGDLTPDWYEQRMRANLAELAGKMK